MTDLIDRLQGLSAGDRDVDLSIMRYVENIGGPADNALPYTASLDAAMTLVPEGWMVTISIAADSSAVTLIDDRVNPVRLPMCDGMATTPAIALCISYQKLWGVAGKIRALALAPEGSK